MEYYVIRCHPRKGGFFKERMNMWKDIKGYEGFYQVSDEGEVRRILKSGRTKPLHNRDGKYYTVILSKPGQKKCCNVHRLVAEHFLDKPEGATEVNHKDGNKKNNNVSNLEWVTSWENRVHAMEELHHFPFGKPAKKVRCRDSKTNEIVAEYHSLADAARHIGKMSAKSQITLVCQGYVDSAYGYRWEYINN